MHSDLSLRLIIGNQVVYEFVEGLGRHPAEFGGPPHPEPTIGRLERNVDALLYSGAWPNQAPIQPEPASELVGEINITDVLGSRQVQVARHTLLANRRQSL